jgi:hypothetical protein
MSVDKVEALPAETEKQLILEGNARKLPKIPLCELEGSLPALW